MRTAVFISFGRMRWTDSGQNLTRDLHGNRSLRCLSLLGCWISGFPMQSLTGFALLPSRRSSKFVIGTNPQLRLWNPAFAANSSKAVQHAGAKQPESLPLVLPSEENQSTFKKQSIRCHQMEQGPVA